MGFAAEVGEAAGEGEVDVVVVVDKPTPAALPARPATSRRRPTGIGRRQTSHRAQITTGVISALAKWPEVVDLQARWGHDEAAVRRSELALSGGY